MSIVTKENNPELYNALFEEETNEVEIMTEEIKEILDRLDFNEWEVDLYKVPITWSELYDIRDYITNLQKEKDNYKSRNEKAVEYIKSHNPSDIGICGNNKKYYYTLNEDSVDNLLNILEGGDE